MLRRLQPDHSRAVGASMFLGFAIAAIGQTQQSNVDGLFLDAHMGYALIGLCGWGTELGVKSMLVLSGDLRDQMNIGPFAFILGWEKDGQPVTDITALNMYSKRAPGKALAMLGAAVLARLVCRRCLGSVAKTGRVLASGRRRGLIWLVVASCCRLQPSGPTITCALSDVISGPKGMTV